MHRHPVFTRTVHPALALSIVTVSAALAATILLGTATASAATLTFPGAAVGAAASGGSASGGSTAGTADGTAGGSLPDVTPLTAARIRTASSADVFAGGLYVDPTGQAAQAAAALAAEGDSDGAADARALAAYPTAIWIGDWLSDDELTSTVHDALTGAERSGTTPVFVTYAIPDRDCGSYSAGGYSPDAYRAWSVRIAGLLAGHRAVVLVEPDSLALLTDCPAAAATRLPLIADQVHRLSAVGVPTYLDAGNSHWNPASTMAERLRQADVAEARGFFTNVSNYYPTADERAYAAQLSGMLDGADYVIDASRNGAGWTGTWCNAPGSGLGSAPSIVTDGSALDALLWVKPPGTSDGECNGGPAAGAWYADMARALLANRAAG